MRQSISQRLPGIGVTVITGLAALFLSEHYVAPVMLFALLLGIAVSFLYEDTQCKAGIDFAATSILRIGVGLIGLRIALSDLVSLGWQTGVLIAVAVSSTIALGVLLARLSGQSKQFGALSGGAVGICGASAALAISSVLPESEHKERDTLLTVIGVTVLSTVAMVLYPIIAVMLDLDVSQASVFLGGTIHDVAQVVGAGYSVSEQTGDLATLTKLVRVSMLVPVVLIFIMVLRGRHLTSDSAKPPVFPRFLIAFVVLMLVNSSMQLPGILIESATQVSRFFLILAITAIGMKSNLKKLLEVGIRPLLIMFTETLWIAVLFLSYLLMVP